MCMPEKVIELCQWYFSAVGNARINEKACKTFFRLTPYGFRQVVQHVSNPVAYEIN